jgi:hypothetical protein
VEGLPAICVQTLSGANHSAVCFGRGGGAAGPGAARGGGLPEGELALDALNALADAGVALAIADGALPVVGATIPLGTSAAGAALVAGAENVTGGAATTGGPALAAAPGVGVPVRSSCPLRSSGCNLSRRA